MIIRISLSPLVLYTLTVISLCHMFCFSLCPLVLFTFTVICMFAIFQPVSAGVVRRSRQLPVMSTHLPLADSLLVLPIRRGLYPQL